jgi:hypothetical protein
MWYSTCFLLICHQMLYRRLCKLPQVLNLGQSLIFNLCETIAFCITCTSKFVINYLSRIKYISSDHGTNENHQEVISYENSVITCLN